MEDKERNQEADLLAYYASCATKKLELYDDFPRSRVVRRVDHMMATWIYRQAIASLQPNAERIIDVGCGVGTLVDYLVLRAPHAKIIGIDLCEELLAVARERFQACDFQRMDLRDADDIAPTGQVVFCLGVINHFQKEELNHVLDRLLRMTTTRLILSFVHSCSFFSRLVGRSYQKANIPYIPHRVSEVVERVNVLGMHVVKCRYICRLAYISPIAVVVCDRRL